MARVTATRAGAILAVTDFEASLAFYRRLGVDVPADHDPDHVQVPLSGDVMLAWDPIETIHSFDADWQPPTGSHRVALAFVAIYDDPPYAILLAAQTRISLAKEGHPAEDRPGVTMRAPRDPSEANVVLVLEVEDARAVHRELTAEGVRILAEPYEPPWGGCRFFCVDPDGYLVEIEQPA